MKKRIILASVAIIIPLVALARGLYYYVVQIRPRQQIQEKVDFLKSHGYQVVISNVNYSALSRNSIKYNSFDEWYNQLTILNTPHENWIGISIIDCYRSADNSRATFWFQSVTINGYTVQYTDYIVTI